MPVDELKARLALPDLPAEGSYHTLAGLLLALLRRVPRVGDRIVFAGWRFEVLEMDGRRVAKVLARPRAGGRGVTAIARHAFLTAARSIEDGFDLGTAGRPMGISVQLIHRP